MEQRTNESDSVQAQKLLNWEFPSFEKHRRGPVWYIVAPAIGLFLLIYSIVQKNFLLAIIVLLLAVILTAKEFIQPQRVSFLVTEDGITIDDKFYRFREFDKFWIAYEPPTIKVLYLEFKRGFRPNYSIPLMDQNPLKVRTVLQKYILEDLERETEDLTDRLGRFFKL
ncbi:hypothetical protein C4546_00735 [Candidatus Parcubacteria bacterium]|jgi:hypothetical protein|nr:MAG: hypothetical protein C4546_00735 [Candidatus Parcubacteria bacterium]